MIKKINKSNSPNHSLKMAIMTLKIYKIIIDHQNSQAKNPHKTHQCHVTKASQFMK